MLERETNPYFAMFHGERVFRSALERMTPQCLAAVQTLMEDRRVVGQLTLEGDCLLWMPEHCLDKIAESIHNGDNEDFAKKTTYLDSLRRQARFSLSA